MELFCVALLTGTEVFTTLLGVAVAVVLLVRPKLCGACTMARYIRNPPTPIMMIPIAATFAIFEYSSRVGLLVSVKILRVLTELALDRLPRKTTLCGGLLQFRSLRRGARLFFFFFRGVSLLFRL